MDTPDELVPAVGDEVDKLALSLHVEDVATELNKGEVEDDDCESSGGRFTQDLRRLDRKRTTDR